MSFALQWRRIPHLLSFLFSNWCSFSVLNMNMNMIFPMQHMRIVVVVCSKCWRHVRHYGYPMIGIISPFARSRAAPLACSFFHVHNERHWCLLSALSVYSVCKRERESGRVEERCVCVCVLPMEADDLCLRARARSFYKPTVLFESCFFFSVSSILIHVFLLLLSTLVGIHNTAITNKIPHQPNHPNRAEGGTSSSSLTPPLLLSPCHSWMTISSSACGGTTTKAH